MIWGRGNRENGENGDGTGKKKKRRQRHRKKKQTGDQQKKKKPAETRHPGNKVAKLTKKKTGGD